MSKMPEDLPLYENGAAPPQPPADEVRITDYRVMPWPDGTRVTVELGLTPYKVFPAADVMVVDTEGDVLRMATLVGSLERRPSPTLFLPRLPRGTPLCVVVDMINNGQTYMQYKMPFEVAGPIIKRTLEEA